MNYEQQKLRYIKEGLILLFGIILGMLLMLIIAACIMQYKANSATAIEDTTLYNHSEIPDTLANYPYESNQSF